MTAGVCMSSSSTVAVSEDATTTTTKSIIDRVMDSDYLKTKEKESDEQNTVFVSKIGDGKLHLY